MIKAGNEKRLYLNTISQFLIDIIMQIIKRKVPTGFIFFNEDRSFKSEIFETREKREEAIETYTKINSVSDQTDEDKMDFNTIMFYFRNDFKINKISLVHLNRQELKYLFKHFAYRMARIVKYGNNAVDFEDALKLGQDEKCYGCGKSIRLLPKHEVLGFNAVEFMCQNCFSKRRIKPFYDLEGLDY